MPTIPPEPVPCCVWRAGDGLELEREPPEDPEEALPCDDPDEELPCDELLDRSRLLLRSRICFATDGPLFVRLELELEPLDLFELDEDELLLEDDELDDRAAAVVVRVFVVGDGRGLERLDDAAYSFSLAAVILLAPTVARRFLGDLLGLRNVLLTLFSASTLSARGGGVLLVRQRLYGLLWKVPLTGRFRPLRRWLTAFGTPFLLSPAVQTSLGGLLRHYFFFLAMPPRFMPAGFIAPPRIIFFGAAAPPRFIPAVLRFIARGFIAMGQSPFSGYDELFILVARIRRIITEAL